MFQRKGLFAFEDCLHIVTYVETTKYVHQTTMQQCFISKETFFEYLALTMKVCFLFEKPLKI